MKHNLENHGSGTGRNRHRQGIGCTERSYPGEGPVAKYRGNQSQEHAYGNHNGHKDQSNSNAVIEGLGS